MDVCKALRLRWHNVRDYFRAEINEFMSDLNEPTPCDRKEQVGPDISHNALAACALLVWIIAHAGGVVALFFIDPALNHANRWWFVTTFKCLMTMNVAAFVLARVKDPGYIKQRSPSDLQDELAPSPTSSAGRLLETSTCRPSDEQQRNTCKGQWCQYCGVWQPLRAKHCKDCNACVLKFDHHCIWIGKCIGRHNHAPFLLYLYLQLLVIWMGLHECIIKLNIDALMSGQGQPYQQQVVTCTLLLVLLGSVVFVGFLTAFHTYLAVCNLTTYEVLKREKLPYLQAVPEDVSPFDKGCRGNCYAFCCSHTPDEPTLDLTGTGGGKRERKNTWCNNQYYSCC